MANRKQDSFVGRYNYSCSSRLVKMSESTRSKSIRLVQNEVFVYSTNHIL